MSGNGGVVISKKLLIIIISAVCLLIIGGVLLGLSLNNQFGEGSNIESAQSAPDIDPNASEWEGQTPTNKGDASEGIKIPGYPSITVPANSETVTVALLNPEGNPCYFVFELVLSDSGETLYKSKLVPPGQAITSVSLSKALDVGEYDAIIEISTYSLEDQSQMNGANVETVLIAK